MSGYRAFSSPDLSVCLSTKHRYDDSALEGVAATIKLLLKLVEDHKEACHKEKNDPRRMLRVAGMMTVLENVRSRIEKCQSFGNKRPMAELRRCESDLRPCNVPREKRPIDQIMDEKESLRKELSACRAARKSLEMMCSSLGKEKEIMASELARKVHELNGMEELINDLRAQNERLLVKVKKYASEDINERGGKTYLENAVIQDQNMALSEQLLRSFDGYRHIKRRLKGAQEENAMMLEKMEELGAKLRASLRRIQELKEKNTTLDIGHLTGIEGEMSELEQMFTLFNMKGSQAGHKTKNENFSQPNGEINAA